MPTDGHFSIEGPREDLESRSTRAGGEAVAFAQESERKSLEADEEATDPAESVLVQPPSPESGPATSDGPERSRTVQERMAEVIKESLENVAEKAVFVGADLVIPGAGTALERAKKVVELAQAAEDFLKNKPVRLELPIVMIEGSLVGFDMTARLSDGEVQEVGVALDVFPAGIDGDTPGVEPAEEDEESGGEAVDEPEAIGDPQDPEDSPEQRPGKDSSAVPESEDATRASEVAGDAERVGFRAEREIGLGRAGGSYAPAGDTRPRLPPVPRLELPEDEPVAETAVVVDDLVLPGVRYLDADRIRYARRRVFARLHEAEPPDTPERAQGPMKSPRTILFVDTVSGIRIVVNIDPADGVAYSLLPIPIKREISGPVFAAASRGRPRRTRIDREDWPSPAVMGRLEGMTPEERRQFVRDHRMAIFGYSRKHDGPAMTALYYIIDGDDILVSTMRARGKTAAVLRDPKVSLCVLDEKWPPTYVNVYCDAVVDDDPKAGADLLFDILGVMAGRPLSEDARPEVEEMSRREERVVLRLRPYATFATPPRHVNTEEDLAGLTHWTSASVPWDA